MARNGIPRTVYTYNALINMYGESGDMDAVNACFAEASAAGKVDVITFSAMLGVWDRNERVCFRFTAGAEAVLPCGVWLGVVATERQIRYMGNVLWPASHRLEAHGIPITADTFT